MRIKTFNQKLINRRCGKEAEKGKDCPLGYLGASSDGGL